jgi:ligand-binding sensor domain-containing protein
VYASLNGYRFDNFAPYLYVSEDYGANWKTIGKDLPYEPINVIKEDPKNDSILYVGTDGGLYVSFDQGNSFMSWNTGLPKSVPVHDIAIQQRENEIVLGTHGRSIYIAKLDDVQALKKDPEWMKKKAKPKEVKKTEEEED